MLRAALVACVLLASSPVLAQSGGAALDGLSRFVLPDPTFGLSPLDRVFVVYEEACGRPQIDIARPPAIVSVGQTVAVDIYLIEREDPLCFSAPPPPRAVPVELGSLATKGLYGVTRRLHVRAPTDTEYRLVSTQSASFRVGDTPHRAISGAWFDPDEPGTGLFVAVIPEGQIPDGNPIPDPRPFVALYLADLSRAGAPAWSTGLGRFENGVLRVAMTDGGESSPNRELVFRYLGCGRAELTDAQGPTFVTLLRQLTRIDGIPNCLPQGVAAPR